MALSLLTTTAFEKDLKRVGKQGRKLDKIEAVVNLLSIAATAPNSLAGPTHCAGTGQGIGIATLSLIGFCSIG